MKLLKKYLPVIVIIIGAFMATASLFSYGLPPTHDGEYHVVRFFEFDKSLRDGNLYPRWAPDLNYGYGVPLFNYVYPLPNYSSFIFHFFGVSFIDSFKLIMILSFTLGGVFFFLWSRQFWGNRGGLIGSFFYMYSPYFFVDIFIRGSVGEVMALGLFPAFLWSATKVINENKKIFIPFSGFLLSLIIFSHNILAFAFFPFAMSYLALMIYLNKDKYSWIAKIKDSLIVIFLALGLSCIFWLPAVFEKNYVTGLQIFDVSKNFAEVSQLIIPSWGSGFFGNGTGNEMSIQIGIANIFAFIVSFIVAFSLFKKKDKKSKLVIFFIFWFIFLFFLIVRSSSFIWNTIPLVNFFQFPWRFLSLIILVSSFLAASISSLFPSRILMVIMIIFVILLGIGYTHPAYFLKRNDNYYTTRSNFIDGTNSPGNVFNTIWNKGISQRAKQKATITQNSGSQKVLFSSSSRYAFDTLIAKNSKMVINTSYFPGWSATIDGRTTLIKPTNNGLISFNIAKGKYKVELEFRNTKIRNIASAISVIVFLIGIILIKRNFEFKK